MPENQCLLCQTEKEPSAFDEEVIFENEIGKTQCVCNDCVGAVRNDGMGSRYWFDKPANRVRAERRNLRRADRRSQASGADFVNEENAMGLGLRAWRLMSDGEREEFLDRTRADRDSLKKKIGRD